MLQELAHLNRRAISVRPEVRVFPSHPSHETEFFTPKPPQPTIGNILGRKLCDHIEATPLATIAKRVALFGAFVVGGVVLVAPDACLSLGLGFIKWHDYLVPRLAVLGLAVFKHDALIAWYQSSKKFIKNRYTPKQFEVYRQEISDEEESRFIGKVSAEHIVEFLVDAGKFPAAIVQKRFGISTHEYQGIIAELSAARLIERGANNSWVAKSDISESELDDFIARSPLSNGVKINHMGILLSSSSDDSDE